MIRSRRALTQSSVLALAVCVLAQLAGSVHSAAVRHVACSEHGGVVEVHGDRAAEPQRANPAILGADNDAHHAHCERCATPTARAFAPMVAQQVLSLAHAAAPQLTTTPLAQPQPRYRLAPKGSPPASLRSI